MRKYTYQTNGLLPGTFLFWFAAAYKLWSQTGVPEAPRHWPCKHQQTLDQLFIFLLCMHWHMLAYMNINKQHQDCPAAAGPAGATPAPLTKLSPRSSGFSLQFFQVWHIQSGHTRTTERVQLWVSTSLTIVISIYLSFKTNSVQPKTLL